MQHFKVLLMHINSHTKYTPTAFIQQICSLHHKLISLKANCIASDLLNTYSVSLFNVWLHAGPPLGSQWGGGTGCVLKMWRASLDSYILPQGLYRQPWPLAFLVCSAMIVVFKSKIRHVWETNRSCRVQIRTFIALPLTFYLPSYAPFFFSLKPLLLFHPVHHNCWTRAKAGRPPDFFIWCKVA